jgi:hypothetical protein
VRLLPNDFARYDDAAAARAEAAEPWPPPPSFESTPHPPGCSASSASPKLAAAASACRRVAAPPPTVNGRREDEPRPCKGAPPPHRIPLAMRRGAPPLHRAGSHSRQAPDAPAQVLAVVASSDAGGCPTVGAPVRETGEGGMGGERAPGEGEESPAPGMGEEAGTGDLRHRLQGAPYCCRRGASGEDEVARRGAIESARAPPSLPGRTPAAGGGDVQHPREQRSSWTWCAPGRWTRRAREGGRGALRDGEGGRGAGDCRRRRRSAWVLGRWEGNPVGRGRKLGRGRKGGASCWDEGEK